MTKRIYTLLLLLLLYPHMGISAAYVYDYNENCARAYRNYLSLHLPEARAAIITEMKANPYNLMSTYISDYEDYIVLLLNCDPHEYELREPHFDARLRLLEHGDRSSPWYRLCEAGLYMHWAVVQLRFGEQYKAALNFHRSFSLLKENQQLFPSFEYNNVFAGLQEAVVGSLPGNYKWLAAVFGMKGNMRKGVEKLSAFINTHTDKQPLYLETVLYYSYTRFYLLQEQKEVWAFLNGPQFQTTNNLLNTFAKVNIALDFRKSDAAIQELQAAEKNADYNKYPFLDYQYGVALLYKLDIGCLAHFRAYLQKNKSDIFIKDTWQKMAFANYFSGNTAAADECLQQVLTQGTARLDADKQAKRFAENKVWPMNQVLQARLLIEGGYYERALALLHSINAAQLSRITDKLEYYFRLGKAYQESGNNEKAISNYQLAINEGKERHEQFAARAALQMGQIYEQTGRKQQAIDRYNECLDMPAHDFQNSIDQQAKAGLLRLREK